VILFRVVKIVLKVIGAILACIFLGITAFIAYLGHESRRVDAISREFVPGMTLEQLVAALPTDFFSASIGVLTRKEPCKDASGGISPPEEYPVLFPDMKSDDEEGKELAWDAAQIPFRLDRFELLDKHLRARRDWSILIQAWTSAIQDSEHPNAIAYCRRGSAYLALDDFEHGYADTKKSCELGCKECCIGLKKVAAGKSDHSES
jgi:hypothetical protein